MRASIFHNYFLHIILSPIPVPPFKTLAKIPQEITINSSKAQDFWYLWFQIIMDQYFCVTDDFIVYHCINLRGLLCPWGRVICWANYNAFIAIGHHINNTIHGQSTVFLFVVIWTLQYLDLRILCKYEWMLFLQNQPLFFLRLYLV